MGEALLFGVKVLAVIFTFGAVLVVVSLAIAIASDNSNGKWWR